MRVTLANARIFGPVLLLRLATHRWRTETLPNAIVRRLPRRVVYFAAIRLWAHATTGPWSDTVVGELEIGEALTRWDLAPRKDT